MLNKIYKLLLKEYGPQGWWPVVCNSKFNDTQGYHINNFSVPENVNEKYEIIVGAVLTQNTSWKNVTKTLLNLKENKYLNPEKIIKTENDKLAELIRSSGYHNQKAKKLKIFTEFLIENDFLYSDKTPEREQLLSIWGVGPETADSILLYAYKIKSFVIDAYTKRIFSRIGLIKSEEKYENVKEIFEAVIPSNFIIYNEYHALIVEHAKQHCSKKPVCGGCPLEGICKKIV